VASIRPQSVEVIVSLLVRLDVPVIQTVAVSRANTASDTRGVHSPVTDRSVVTRTKYMAALQGAPAKSVSANRVTDDSVIGEGFVPASLQVQTLLSSVP
jgi:hypothetical protein